MTRERNIARITGIAVELKDGALEALLTLAERLRAEPDAPRDITTSGLAHEQRDREATCTVCGGSHAPHVVRDSGEITAWHAGDKRAEAPTTAPIIVSATRFGVLAEIAGERNRQIARWGDGLPPGGFGPPVTQADINGAIIEKGLCEQRTKGGTVSMRDVLEEEIAEVFAEEPGSAAQRTELVQVAAVCVKMIEAIDAKGGAR